MANWWRRYPDDYIEPSDNDWLGVPLTLEAFSNASDFASWINDGGVSSPGRDVNCADCARAVEVSWRGEPQVSAARAPQKGGELLAQIEEWLGTELEEDTFNAIAERLGKLGHGASAYVVVYWKGGGAHAFNAVNRNGAVYWVDAHHPALVGLWPPRRLQYPSRGYDDRDVEVAFAALRNRGGSSI